MDKKIVPIIIPAYEPGVELISICKSINEKILMPVIIVNDGSSEDFNFIFDAVESDGSTVIKHAVNLGKGRGLKTAFNYVLNNYPDAVGVVTADSDGQHKVGDIERVVQELVNNPNELILGVRDFDMETVPWKSKFGNELTKMICDYLCDVKVSDTQTGLRGIPKYFMEYLMNISGERFEFETIMLIDTKDRVVIREIPIETVYDSKEDHKTHFDPVLDSIRIYKIFGKIFAKYLISSLSSFALDIILFAFFCSVLRNKMPLYYVVISTVLARIISAAYNFAINYSFVFKSDKRKTISALKYFVLAAVIMGFSALLTTIGVAIFNPDSEFMVKIVVDTLLFFISYKIQQKTIF